MKKKESVTQANKEWPRKRMSQEMTQRKESVWAFFLRLAVGSLKWLFFNFIWKYEKNADEHYNRSKLGSW